MGPENIEARKQYCLRAIRFEENDLCFVDETGFNLHTSRRRGRSRIGERAYRESVSQRGGNISLCAAISPKRGLLHYKVKLGAFNSEEYVAFLRELFAEAAFQHRPHIVVQDNAKFHKTAEVKEVYEEGRCQHQQEFIPPYSPQLNMIEECWNKIKAYVKRLEKSDQASLLRLIDEAYSTVNVDDAKGWYRQLTRVYIECAAGKPLL